MYKIDDILAEKNYSKCPLKKRPVNYQFNSEDKGAGTAEAVASLCKIEKKTVLKSEQEKRYCSEEPENLSLKKETWNGETTISCSSTVKDEMLINVSNDSCEDEGVDVDHIDDEDEDDEMIDCVDIEEDDNGDAGNTTQAAALAAAAAVAAASAAVVVPQPTYPNYGIQPWNFHMSPYTAEFYRTINNPHLTQQISPLGSELLSPSSPSESLSSLSPPPHYLHGRPSSVSPPMRSDIIHCPIGLRQLPQPKQPQPQQQHQHQHQHRFMPFPTIPTYHVPHQTNAYPFSYHHHHAPISPAYSDSSYFSLRSMTPESNCSSVPEDLSLKHNALQKLTPVHISPRSEHSSNNVDMVSSSNNMINGTASNGS
ncbi:protein escargot, partial [Teleopsis dalmanni]|uniref:protein escargot n=1 Tax=Teleopsis dalmanni TaxID=139649 RepID=UPI0018CED23C